MATARRSSKVTKERKTKQTDIQIADEVQKLKEQLKELKSKKDKIEKKIKQVQEPLIDKCKKEKLSGFNLSDGQFLKFIGRENWETEDNAEKFYDVLEEDEFFRIAKVSKKSIEDGMGENGLKRLQEEKLLKKLESTYFFKVVKSDDNS